MLLIFHYGDEHLEDVLFDGLADACEAEHLLEDLVGHLLGRNLSIEDVLLKEGILAVHMRAVEETISVHDVVEVVILHILSVVVLFILNVVLVTLHVLLFYQSCSW